jgi:hypothetical protein
MEARRSIFLAGLFLTTLSTLTLEILDTRLLSVITWYHLSFFAVSTAMFGMAAGAVRVYLGERAFGGRAAPRALARNATLLALSIPVTNLVNLCIPIPAGSAMPTVVTIALTSLVLAVPFYLSGIVVAIALTRIPGPSGRVYAVDLLGAALGSLAVLALFELTSITSAALVLGGITAAGAACFHHFAATGRVRRQLALAASLFAMAGLNDLTGGPLGVIWAKGAYQDPGVIEYEYWTIHGQVIATKSDRGRPFYWGRGFGTSPYRVERIDMLIDGAAGTSMTRWDGRPGSLEWVKHDVTALPYHLRKGGDAAVIGVGGGRDVLTALWAGSRSVTGIEINDVFLELLEGPLREYAALADHPRVTLVHDEARSYLTRTDERFDILQMSLIDTWAATGAGAFTLSENGLYTLEAWETFLGTLKPGGLFSVSRWYSPGHTSETSRLVALATAALLANGIPNPRQHMILVTTLGVATLVVSNHPFGATDLTALDLAARNFGFQVLLAPHRPAPEPSLARIADARNPADLAAAAADPRYDYTPPTDERPYFFNTLKPGSFLFRGSNEPQLGVVAGGNRLATITLGILWMVTFALVAAVVIGPLARSSLPQMSAASFTMALSYFALIGAGFMLVQIPLMQRFSVYLGHPTYSVAVILFSMILATGLGSFLSDWLDVESSPRWLRVIPPLIAVDLLFWTLAIQPIIDTTIQLGLVQRILVVVTAVSLAALPLGLCFPIGLRLVRRISDDATPWMWGVNGAAGVLASVSAVAISMWSGISTSLFLATGAYALLVVPALALWYRGGSVREVPGPGSWTTRGESGV